MNSLPLDLIKKISYDFLPVQDVNSFMITQRSGEELAKTLQCLQSTNLLKRKMAQILLVIAWLRNLQRIGRSFRRIICMDHYDDHVRILFEVGGMSGDDVLVHKRMVVDGKSIDSGKQITLHTLFGQIIQLSTAGYQLVLRCGYGVEIPEGDTPRQRRVTKKNIAANSYLTSLSDIVDHNIGVDLLYRVTTLSDSDQIRLCALRLLIDAVMDTYTQIENTQDGRFVPYISPTLLIRKLYASDDKKKDEEEAEDEEEEEEEKEEVSDHNRMLTAVTNALNAGGLSHIMHFELGRVREHLSEFVKKGSATAPSIDDDNT
jgi:hypothetical protein